MYRRSRSLWLAAVCCWGLATVAADAEIRMEVRPDGSLYLHNLGEKRAPVVRRVVGPAPDLAAHLGAAATSARLEPELVDAVIRVESGYDPRAVSHKGAIGLMQLMPQTAQRMGVDPWNPLENLSGGTRYLREMLDQFDDRLELALAAYNAGPKTVERYGGIPPYPETRAYVERVLRIYRRDPSYALPAAGPAVGRKVVLGRDPNTGQITLTTSSARR